MTTAYQYDALGYYVGNVEDFGLLPNNATYEAPEHKEGFIPKWNKENVTWQYLEDYIGKQGYVNGEPFTMTTYGALPEGFSETPPEPTEEELNQTRIAEIKSKLQEIDNLKIRPVSVIASWWALPEDKRDPKGIQDESTLLLQLDKESSMLREELHVIEMYEVEKEE